LQGLYPAEPVGMYSNARIAMFLYPSIVGGGWYATIAAMRNL